MVLPAIAINVSKLVLYPAKPGIVKKLCGSSLPSLAPIFAATITSKHFRDETNKRPPFPYKEKKYNVWRSLFDSTCDRFDENSKIIVVEGPIACGKTAFAKELADELGMYHIPEPNMDLRYINRGGFDLRQLDDQLPVSVQSFDEKKFCMDPFHLNVAAFQMWMYRLRVSIYIDALAHIFSTGQGVVVERCPWSDMVFLEAMYKNGYISKEAKGVYSTVKKETIGQLLRPHLIIYLDVPVASVMDKIKKRNYKHEVQGKALTEKYLTDLDDAYKNNFLPSIESHTDILVYDWTNPGNAEAIVEDLERMDLDSYTKHGTKCKDWFIGVEEDWCELRAVYADQKRDCMAKFNVPLLDAPELIASGDDLSIRDEVYEKIPGSRYQDGFDPELDSNLLFKTSGLKYVPY